MDAHQSKNELGWADFRVTAYAQIEKWWELVMSAYLLVSLHSQVLNNPPNQSINQVPDPIGKNLESINGGTRVKDGRIYLIIYA